MSLEFPGIISLQIQVTPRILKFESTTEPHCIPLMNLQLFDFCWAFH